MLMIAACGSAAAGDITVTITGVRNNAGSMRVALFDSEIEFPNGRSILDRKVPAREGEMTIVLESMPAGIYALALHHDENNNSKMDTSLLGLPQEGYGFSNDAPVFLGAPPFSAAAFNVPEEGRHIRVKVVY